MKFPVPSTTWDQCEIVLSLRLQGSASGVFAHRHGDVLGGGGASPPRATAFTFFPIHFTSFGPFEVFSYQSIFLFSVGLYLGVIRGARVV